MTDEKDQFPTSGGPCETCFHSVWEDDDRDKLGSCRAAPPIVQLIQVGLDEQSRPVMSPISAWPPVRRRQGCAKFCEILGIPVETRRKSTGA